MDELKLLEIFSNNLRRMMNEDKMTQGDLAKEINVDQSMISRYVSGQSLPSLLTTIKIADALFCSIDELIKE